jgi:nucleoside 2-deoxyribosyltransferase
MRIFISYRYTGIPRETLDNTVTKLITVIRNLNHEVFCNLENDNKYISEKWTSKQIMEECFQELKNSNYHITFIAPDSGTGEGLLIELGYAKALELPTLLLLPKDFHSISSKAVVNETITYENIEELLDILLPKHFDKK